MSLERSTEDLDNLSTTLPNCNVCKNAITSPAYLCKSNCGHYFHKSCYQKFIKTKQICPVCGSKLSLTMLPVNSPSVPPPIVTRSQAQRAQEFDSNRPSNPPSTPRSKTQQTTETNCTMSTSSPQDQREHIRNLVTAAVGAQQAEMLTVLIQQLTKIIETNIEAGFRNLSLANSRNESSQTKEGESNSNSRVQNLPAVEQQTLEQLLGLPSNERTTDNNASHSTNQHPNSNHNNSHDFSNSLVRPDKVGHIIHNWKIKIAGDQKGMSVENFIYRV